MLVDRQCLTVERQHHQNAQDLRQMITELRTGDTKGTKYEVGVAFLIIFDSCLLIFINILLFDGKKT